MTTVPNAEFESWNTTRSARKYQEGDAVIAASSVPIGGSSSASQASDYMNQQDGADKDELKIDAGLGALPVDFYTGKSTVAEQGTEGYPPTKDMEQHIYDAALRARYETADTIDPQNQIALMQAARKAHNNWRQRRQQLLTHNQMRAANQVAIQRDFENMANGKPLNGIV